jgi:hypothetical protein
LVQKLPRKQPFKSIRALATLPVEFAEDTVMLCLAELTAAHILLILTQEPYSLRRLLLMIP